MSRNITIGLFILLLFEVSLYSLNKDIKFDRLSREDGLSNSTVYSIIEDEKGFLWFGTPDGLNKYDGRDFTVYKSNLNDPASIPNSSAGNLFIDSNGIIWIGSWGGGLLRYDPRYDSFTQFSNDSENDKSISDNRVQSLYEDTKGKLWFGTYNGGLNRFDFFKGEFVSFKKQQGDNSSISDNRIWTIIEDEQGQLWIGTSRGLNLFDEENNSFQVIKNSSGFIIRNSLITNDQSFWFGTNKGLFRYDSENDEIIETIFTDRIYALFEDSQNIMWIGTSKGLIQYDYKKNEYIRYKNTPENFYSLPVDSVRAIFEDSSGVMWIGTDGGGLCKFNNYPKSFNHYYSDKSKENSLNSNNVFAFEENNSREIWIGTKEGLHKWIKGTNHFDLINENEIRALEKDANGDLWVGARDGLYRYSLKDEMIIPYDFDIREIRSILLDSTGMLWVGTYKNGLYQYDIKQNILKNILPVEGYPDSLNHKEIWTLFEDSTGDIWIGTGEGLNRLIKGTEAFKSYKINENDKTSLLGIRIYSVYEDSNNNIWIGTDEGLNLWFRESDSFSRLVKDDGLSDKSVKSIIEDEEGNLWLGSNDGLTKYNPETGASYVYGTEDNLQGREFNVNSTFFTEDGLILFGGIHGFNSFNPFKITESSYSPPVVLTGFTVKGKDYAFNDIISYIRDINLTYKENFFTFKFKALDFSSSGENSYAYKLEGVDKDWVYIHDRNHVSYTNIDGGLYTFRVKAANSDQIWNDDELSVTISVTSPPWKRWWALVLYLVIFISSITALVYWKIEKHKKETALHKSFVDRLEEKVLERTVELKLLNNKLERLSNIDDLTSLFNRRYFGKRYSSEWNRLQRVKLPLSVLMCDIDHFKLYNDYYGHQAGDTCIKEVAKTIREHCVRTTDLAIRYGGEEFLIILPQTDSAGALSVAGSIRESIEKKMIKHEYSLTLPYITISIGVASIIPRKEISSMVLVEMADKALYECKDSGRNKIFLYSDKLEKPDNSK